MEFVKKKVNIDATNPFITSPTNKVIHTQTKLQQKPTNCLSVFDHSVGLVEKKPRQKKKVIVWKMILLSGNSLTLRDTFYAIHGVSRKKSTLSVAFSLCGSY